MKTLAKIRRIEKVDGAEVETEKVEIFNSVLEFVTFMQATNPIRKDVISGALLNEQEVNSFLAPLKSAVADADSRKAEAKKILEECAAANRALFEVTGPGFYFQDPLTDVVYKTDFCEGRFVYFETVEVKRTRREGETKGTLSMKEAKEAGFTLPEAK